MKMVPLGDLMPTRTQTLNPAKYADEEFELHSIPAFDRGRPDDALGRDIGSAKQVVQPGDVLISKIVPHIRRSAAIPQHAGRRQLASSEWIVFRNQSFDPKYLVHFLTSDTFHQQFLNTVAGVGGSLLRARPQYVRSIMAPLPPLDEQRRIAAILDKADAIRQKRRQAIAHLESLTQSIFHEMFGNAKSRSSRLGDSLEFLTSGSRGWSRYYQESGDLFLRIQNVGHGHLRLNDLTYVDAPQTAEARRTRVQPGDVLLSITADLGRSAVVPEGLGTAFINQHLAILRAPNINSHYLSAFLSHGAGLQQVIKKDRGATKAGLNFDDIRSIAIPLPPIEQQAEFATRVASNESLATRVNRLEEQASSLFESLQSRAFRGEL